MDGAIIVDESPERRRGRRSVKRSTRRRAKFRRGPSGCGSDHGGGISGHAKHAHEAAAHIFGCQTGDVAVCDGQGDHFSDGEGDHHDDQNRHTEKNDFVAIMPATAMPRAKPRFTPRRWQPKARVRSGTKTARKGMTKCPKRLIRVPLKRTQ